MQALEGSGACLGDACHRQAGEAPTASARHVAVAHAPACSPSTSVAPSCGMRVTSRRRPASYRLKTVQGVGILAFLCLVNDVSTVVVASANVTSLEAHWDAVAAAKWDFLTIQEARVSPDTRIVRDVLRAGGDVRLGPLGEDGKALICTICRRGSLTKSQPIPGSDPLRAQRLAWYPGGPCSWNSCNIYAEADGSVES